MQDYRKLIAWQRAHGMTLAVHQVFARRPRGGLPGLSAQILRSAAATAANIAEGCGRRSSAELAVLFSTVVLFTGALWGKVIWGAPWVWDARLTSFLILWLVYVAYFVLRRLVPGARLHFPPLE